MKDNLAGSFRPLMVGTEIETEIGIETETGYAKEKCLNLEPKYVQSLSASGVEWAEEAEGSSE